MIHQNVFLISILDYYGIGQNVFLMRFMIKLIIGQSKSGLIKVQCSSLSEAIVIYSLIKMYNDNHIEIKDMTRLYDYYIKSNMINHLEEYIMSSE